MSVWVRVAAAIAVSLLLGLGLAAFLGFHKFRNAVTELERTRALASIVDARDAIEGALSLGLRLRDAESVQDILARTAARDAKLEKMMVFDRGGSVLFGVPADADRPAQIEGAWLALNRKSARNGWHVETPGNLAVGSAVLLTSGVVVGGVVAHYDAAARDGAVREMTRLLLFTVGGLFLLAVPVLALLSWWLCRPLRRDAQRIEHRLASLAEAEPEGAPDDSPLERFLGHAAAVERAMTEIERRLGRPSDEMRHG